jgi:hypothetical protein
MSHFDDNENARADAELAKHLAHLLEAELVKKENQPIHGITKQVEQQGRSSLSGKQEWVFRTEVFELFCQQKCELCGEPIPVSEAWDVELGDLNTVCSSCRHDISKRA